jgi:hypothetical protein
MVTTSNAALGEKGAEIVQVTTGHHTSLSN